MPVHLIDHAHVQINGVFRLKVFRRGALIEAIEERNLVVDLAKTGLARMLGSDLTNRPITQIGFGTSGTAPAAGNTSLTGGYYKNHDGATFPGAGQVSFAFSLASGENNGMAILEFGLLTASSTLYARKTRTTALNKESDITLSGTWTLTF